MRHTSAPGDCRDDVHHQDRSTPTCPPGQSLPPGCKVTVHQGEILRASASHVVSSRVATPQATSRIQLTRTGGTLGGGARPSLATCCHDPPRG